MKLSRKFWYNFKELLFIIAWWELSFKLYAIIVLLASHGKNHPTHFIRDFFSGDNIFFVNTDFISLGFIGFFIGIITGLAEIYVFPGLFKRKAFLSAILFKKLIYIITILSISAVVIFTNNILTQGVSFTDALLKIPGFFEQSEFIAIFVFGFLVSLGINFILQIKNKISPEVLVQLILGKYYKPKSEERIFLFLDLKSSTGIAEELGHIKFSRLLQDCYRDLSDFIISCRAQVYQYVGDEVVLTWKVQDGIQDLNCINVFFQFQQKLLNKKHYYISKYGIIPVFKAAVHSGYVTVAEVGVVKSEIAYHGDVINTTARIEKQCNHLHQHVLISGDLEQKIRDRLNGYKTTGIGEILLEGKHHPIQVYSVTQ